MSVLNEGMILELPIKITLKRLVEILYEALNSDELLLMLEELNDHINDDEFTVKALALFDRLAMRPEEEPVTKGMQFTIDTECDEKIVLNERCNCKTSCEHDDDGFINIQHKQPEHGKYVLIKIDTHLESGKFPVAVGKLVRVSPSEHSNGYEFLCSDEIIRKATWWKPYVDVKIG